MPRKGPPPKPTALKLLEGNPGKRPLPRNEPKPKPIIPKPPPWMNRYAKKFYNEHAPKLLELGLFTEIDAAMLIFTAECFGEYETYKREIKKSKRYKQTSETGWETPTVEVSLAKEAMKNCKALLLEFGMSPSARSRIDLKMPDDDKDDIDELLSGVK